MGSLLQATCLKPHYSLRYQLFVSYGVTCAIAIGVVILTATLTAKSSGDSVKTQARDLLRDQVIANTRFSSVHAAKTLSKRFENFEGAASLMAEATRDRIVGYPEAEGWENDRYVPFYDTFSGTNVYPLVTDLLPPDWNITVNVDSTNYQEHVQDRWPWYASVPISTAHAVYRIQGQCDPSETNSSSRTYFENCTNANNDLDTGGVIQPTPFSRNLAEKAADLGVFLKPLYEAQYDVKTLGIYFANSGAGSSVVYPAYLIDGLSSFKSIGCEWMRENNPYTNMPYASEEEIGRCHAPGSDVPTREYNPLERQWCRDQALNPERAQIVGPYLDAFNRDLWLMTVGKAVFDRMTGQFLGCTLLDVSIERVGDILRKAKTDENSLIAMVRWDNGTVLYADTWDSSTALETITVSGLGLCDKETFGRLKDLVDFSKPWEPEEVKAAFSQTMFTADGKLLAGFPIPEPPAEFDSAYSPDFMVLQLVGEEVYSLIRDIEAQIDDEVQDLCATTVSIGIMGIIAVLVVTWTVSVFLTRPLNWMMDVAKRIVHPDKPGDSIYGRDKKPLVRCAPKTEITDLVLEFQSIVEGFSGSGPASVAVPGVNEVFNSVSWDENFGREYLEQLFNSPVDGRDGGEHRLSFASSVASHTSIPVDLDDLSINEVDGENAVTGTDKGADTVSQIKRMEEEPSLSSATGDMQKLKVKRGEIEQSPVQGGIEGEAPTALLFEVKIPEELSHAVVSSESTRVNKGPLVAVNPEDRGAGGFENELRSSLNRNQIIHSPLFWWIVVLIVAPVLVTMATICTVVTVNISDVMPSWLKDAEGASVTLETAFISSSSKAHAVLAEEIFGYPISDLHVFTRLSSWLLFGGLKQAESFTDMSQGTEECKTFPNDYSCPFLADKERATCDCRWGDPHAKSCVEYENDRSMQLQFFACQAHDADPLTGDRVNSSFPEVDFSPETTLWWNDTTIMPGALANSTPAQGYETVYDRIRVMSATSVVTVPLYNYRNRSSHPKHLGMYIGFEADGMLAGYSGCDHSHAEYAHFQSNEENGASKIAPDICPLGKFGYDSRCRGWYSDGKTSETLHLTAPYVFAGTGDVANSVTYPLIDPSSGENVGQTVIDFFPEGIDEISREAFLQSRHPNAFIILITPNSDALGGDTIVGPGYKMGGSSPAVQDLVMPCDALASNNRLRFESGILADMKSGRSGEDTFRRLTFERNGDNVTCYKTEENMLLSYAPVLLRANRPLRSDDFARGINVSEILMGSLGNVIPTDDLRAPFAYIEGEAQGAIDKSIVVLIALVAATAAITTIILAKITISIVRPVTVLLEFVCMINKKHALHDIPQMTGGSREVNQVYASLSKLHKIVRFANSSFYSGKIKNAYNFLTDALSLFRRAGDQKAIGIAANNLGNTLMVIRNQKLSTNRCFSINGTCVHRQAAQSYDESICSATNDYEEISNMGNPDLQAKLAEQLANRHFNRGLFFLHSAGDVCADDDSAEKGREDLVKTRSLDAQVRSIWVETRQVHKNAVRYFERLLRRANGLIGLMEKKMTNAGSLNVAELLDEADSLLFVVWNMPGSPLFDAVSPTGRLQQLEGTAIRYKLCQGASKEAARISHRMLVQDEFIDESALTAAASAMLTWSREMPPPGELKASGLALHRSFRIMLRACKNSADVPIGKNVVFFQDIACHDECDYILQGFIKRMSDSCYDVDFIILPSLDESAKEVVLSLKRKSDVKEADWSPGWRRRRVTDINKDFRRAIRLVLESTEASENDTWIIVATDRTRWDPLQCRLSESHHYLLSEMRQLNQARSIGTSHVAIVSMDADDNMAEICSELCRVSRESTYANVKDVPEDLDDALADVALSVIGDGKKCCSIPGGITMEQF